MVKNQNWQKRVETADARRKEAKQRKQSRADTKLHKKHAQEFLNLLERNGHALLENIHDVNIWSESGSMIDLMQRKEEQQSGGGRRRLRAASMDSISSIDWTSSKKQSPRGRSNSVSDHHKKKNRKSDVRRKDSWNDNDDDVKLLLCRSHFFTNACPNSQGNKKSGSGCKHVHYPPNFKTLYQVLAEKSKESKDELMLSKQAAAMPDESSREAMEMVFHASLDVQSDSDLHEQVTSFLSNEQITLASLVYITIDGVLVYDRNREGLLVKDDREFLCQVLGEDVMRHRRFSMSSEQQSQEVLIHFPATVLEHILTFLPDGAVAAASRVCPQWHSEIGQDSPQLWRHLLERRNWPLPSNEDDAQQVFRNAFINHYTVVRDVAAIQKALVAIKTKKSAKETEMTYQDFSKRDSAPSEHDLCVAIQVWSPNHVLAAYERDCSLRLFQALSKGPGSNEKLCREIVCRNIDPYKNTRRMNTTIISMVLDDGHIGCLCRVTQEDDSFLWEAYKLVLLSRNDFLSGDSSDADLNSIAIDVGEATVNYLLSSDNVDHELVDFFQDGGELRELEIVVSQNTLAACGSSRFMMEVSISVPLDDDDHEDLVLLIRKLVLVSAEAGAVLWMRGSWDNLSERYFRTMGRFPEDVNLSSISRSTPGADSVCTVATISWIPYIFTSCDIGPSDQPVHVMDNLDPYENPIGDGWIRPPFRRSILVSPSHVITEETFLQRGQQPRIRSFLRFCPRNMPVDQSGASMVELPRNTRIIRMTCIRDDYVLVLCQTFSSTSSAESASDDANAFLSGDNVAGWRPEPRLVDVHALIFHIPTTCQIGRFCLVEDASEDRNEVPHFTMDSSGTIGVAFSFKGLVMTGQDVRSASDAVLHTATSSPRVGKKKKGRAKRQGKKDEFARGMRQNSG